MQLCVNAQIPEIMGGIEGEALFIDCESLKISRFNEIATLTIKELREKFKENPNVNHLFLHSFTSKKITDGLSILKCKSWEELEVAILRKLDSFLELHPKVKLIIIDSISYLFRYDFEGDIFERTKLLLEVSQKLKEIATSKNICVTFTNHLTHHVDVRQNIPALGASWGHCSNIRLLLERDRTSNLRFFSTTKNFPQKGKYEFTISALGFR
ncbi:DNA repair protein RAD51 3-like isoform X2 [Leptotrombidium deliense]|uniref:DNA repair protein RAD51 homolog 3 n=1 Tax=Leptotrombidium deliense TaxID=299467 RepID=A0A443SRW6_9ACAR|nr:DNA repair protein RAD51 3-like isoform X2 [Leptotrombidium deliense]